MPGLIRLSQGEGREPPKLTVWILAVLGWGFDVSRTIFVELVCKVQLNIVFNVLRVPDFQRHTDGNSYFPCIKSPVRPSGRKLLRIPYRRLKAGFFVC